MSMKGLWEPFEVDGITYTPTPGDVMMRSGMFTLKDDEDEEARSEWTLAQIIDSDTGALSTAELLEAMK